MTEEIDFFSQENSNPYRNTNKHSKNTLGEDSVDL